MTTDLLQALDHDLSDVAKTGWIYKCGVSRDGCTVITVNAAALLELKPSHEKVVSYPVSIPVVIPVCLEGTVAYDSNHG